MAKERLRFGQPIRYVLSMANPRILAGVAWLMFSLMAHAEEPNLVIARHVLLWEGREIVTVQEAEKRIAALASKGEVSPWFFRTSGSVEAAGAGSFHTQISHSETHMLCKTVVFSNPTKAASKRYDAIRTEADLVPDPALRIEAGVKRPDGQPAQDAEVVLCLFEEGQLSYSLGIVGNVPRLRNRIDDLVTRSAPDGSFAHYPPSESKWLLALLHESGFAAVKMEDFKPGQAIALQPWGTVTVEFAGKPSANYPLKASLSNQPMAAKRLGWPSYALGKDNAFGLNDVLRKPRAIVEWPSIR